MFYFAGNGVVDFDEFLVMMAAKVVEGGQPGVSWAHKVPIPYVWDQSFATLANNAVIVRPTSLCEKVRE